MYIKQTLDITNFFQKKTKSVPENYKHDSRSKTSVEVEDKVEKKSPRKQGGEKEDENR